MAERMFRCIVIKKAETLPSSTENSRLTAVCGGPSFGDSTPTHWTSMAARCAPKRMQLQDLVQAQVSS